MLQEVYDTTDEFRSKDSMPRCEVSTLRPNDVVLAECMFVRTEVLGGWQTKFHLTSMAVLHRQNELEEQRKGGTEVGAKFPWCL